VKIKIDPTIRTIAERFFDPLTTPDSEDWSLIYDRGHVHVSALRQNEAGVWKSYGVGRSADLKAIVRGLKPGHDLGCITVIMCADHKERGADGFLDWMIKQAKKKNFSVTSIFGPTSTDEAIDLMRNAEAAFAESEGGA
jgi:hypothetical protein